MKILTVMLIVLAIGYSANSHAVILLGTPSCGQWVAGRTKDSQQASEVVQHIKGEQYKSWLMGYLSGLAAISNAVKNDVDVLKGAEAESIFLWMDNYCKTNPLDTLSDGGLSVFTELAKKSK